MTDHEPQPALCPTCYDDLCAALARGEHRDYHWCRHTRTLVLIEVRDGRVVDWLARAPMSEDDVQAWLGGLQRQLRDVETFLTDRVRRHGPLN